MAVNRSTISSRRSNGNRIWIVLGLVAVISGGSWLAAGTSVASRPFHDLANWIQQKYGRDTNLGRLTAERDQLKQQLTAVTVQLAAARHVLEDTQSIEQIQSYVGQKRLRSLLAAVTAYSPDPGVQSIVLQRGRHDGIEPGLAVITNEGLLVGRVVSVHELTSTALLLNDPQIRILAKVQNEAQSRGIIRGLRGLAVSMEFIPKNDHLERGQAVVTSGLDTQIPPDLVIGTVAQTQVHGGDLFQTATVTSSVQFNRLSVVAVVWPPT